MCTPHQVIYCARHIPITNQERQIRFDLLLSFGQVIARLHVEMNDKALHPCAVALLRANRIVSPPHPRMSSRILLDIDPFLFYRFLSERVYYIQ